MSIFTKVLTETDVNRKLSFPENCVIPALQAFKAEVLLVKDDTGTLWRFVCAIRYGVSPKPVIISGWIQFVQNKGLQEGDTVYFYREDDVISGAHYKIEVRRKWNNDTNANKILQAFGSPRVAMGYPWNSEFC
ncbi:hypothetical protein CCACVL1_16901 [Corchorus capsularis]|uniref:TF-B3 domain-containing protein n=1 Tax=Corchorus capsularis TaxID=210143 RepID=A0A1R3HV48_COCAP|nr:hypothetical protein CCACVL1_16901 [Corchorus capsularis]